MKKCKKQQQFSQIYLVLMVAILAGCQDSRANELDLIKPSDISIDDLTQDPDAATTSDSPEQTTDSTTVTVLDVSDISDTFNSPDPCSGDAYYEYKFLNLCMDLEQDWKMRLGGPCQNDDQCESQICFHHPNVEGEGFCTATCRNDVDCLPGWGCPIQETPPDICTCTPRPEVCDRLDNDCNGLVDDGRPTELGCGPAERCENARCVCNSPLQSDGSCACRSDADCPLICKDGQCLTAIALDVGPSQEGCAVLSDGSVWCWQAYLEQPDRYPIRVEGVSDAVDVVLSESAVCALDRYGFVWCWGSDALGELGNSLPLEDSSVAVQVSNISNITKIVAARYKFCALQEIGTVWCWGRNPLNEDSTVNVFEPVQVQGLNDVIDLVYASIALKRDHSVWIWYESELREIFSPQLNIQRINYLPSQCGLTEDHTVWCYSEDFGVCPFLGSVTTWARNNCILFRDQTVLCRDQRDVLYCDGYLSKDFPYIVPQRSGVERAHSANDLACVLLSTGEIDCWIRDAQSVNSPPETPTPLIWSSTPPQP